MKTVIRVKYIDGYFRLIIIHIRLSKDNLKNIFLFSSGSDYVKSQFVPVLFSGYVMDINQ